MPTALKVIFAVINVATVAAFFAVMWGWSKFVHLAEPGLHKALEALPDPVAFVLFGVLMCSGIWAIWHERKYCR
jgi:uncharacterized membrane protein